MDQVTLAKNQMRAENWRGLISVCQQSGQTVANWCEENNINNLSAATIEVLEGTSQATVEAVLLALKCLCQATLL